MDSKTLNKIAVQMLLTLNPAIKASAKSKIMAFIIKRNNPKLKIVIGKVSKTKSGFTKRFKTDNTTATIIAVT